MSYGGTQLSLDLTSSDASPYVVVEGPLDNYGDTVAVGAGTSVNQTDDGGTGDAHLDLSLASAGVYRIITGTVASLTQGARRRASDLQLAM